MTTDLRHLFIQNGHLVLGAVVELANLICSGSRKTDLPTVGISK